jgi:hypothetical protein
MAKRPRLGSSAFGALGEILGATTLDQGLLRAPEPRRTVNVQGAA